MIVACRASPIELEVADLGRGVMMVIALLSMASFPCLAWVLDTAAVRPTEQGAAQHEKGHESCHTVRAPQPVKAMSHRFAAGR